MIKCIITLNWSLIYHLKSDRNSEIDKITDAVGLIGAATAFISYPHIIYRFLPIKTKKNTTFISTKTVDHIVLRKTTNNFKYCRNSVNFGRGKSVQPTKVQDTNNLRSEDIGGLPLKNRTLYGTRASL